MLQKSLHLVQSLRPRNTCPASVPHHAVPEFDRESSLGGVCLVSFLKAFLVREITEIKTDPSVKQIAFGMAQGDENEIQHLKFEWA